MTSVVIFAGGVGNRMKSEELPKQFIEVAGKPIIIRTLEKFSRHPEIDNIVISCLEDWIPFLKQKIKEFDVRKISAIVKGGGSGHESIHNGLLRVAKKAKKNDIVLICDGVRPMISRQLITNCISGVKEYGTAVPVTPSIDSVLESKDGICCKKSYNRAEMFITQAPQGYYVEKIMQAHEEAKRQKVESPTSSCELLIELGQSVHVFIGERQNIKVTTPEDLQVLRSGYYYNYYKMFAKEELKYET